MQHYTIFFTTVNALHVLGSFPPHHQELKNCTHSKPCTHPMLCVGQFSPPSSGAQKLYTQQALHTPNAVCTVFELLMMGRETA